MPKNLSVPRIAERTGKVLQVISFLITALEAV